MVLSNTLLNNEEELNDPSCMVIATGGLGKIIANETDEIDAYDADIAYKGMKILYTISIRGENMKIFDLHADLAEAIKPFYRW